MKKYVIYSMAVAFALSAVFTACEKDKDKGVPVTGITLNMASVTLASTDTVTLIATVQPDNATNKAVTWSSSNPSVAMVNNGLVTAITEGSAVITVTTDDGNKTASCIITVSNATVPVTSVTLNQTTLTLAVNATETLIATIQPDNATNKNVIWASSNSVVATVMPNGLVTALSKGTTTIVVSTQDGGKSASCVVTVEEVFVTGVTLNKTEMELAEGETEALIATVLPENATNKAVSWTSSNPLVATVNTNGLVSAIKMGTATITVTTLDGNKTATCALTVPYDPGENVVINGVCWATRNVDMPGTFAAKPEDAGMFYQWNRKVGWSSTDPMINSNGGTTWNSSDAPGNTWEKANDPSPAGYRVPTKEELESLENTTYVTHEWTEINGINGYLCTDKATGASLFLPAAGYRDYSSGSLFNAGSSGLYWSSTPSTTTVAYSLYFNYNYFYVVYSYRAYGFSIRCVAE